MAHSTQMLIGVIHGSDVNCAAQFTCNMAFPMKTNITLRIDKELAQEGRILAARRGTSLSRLLAEELEELIQRDSAYTKAMNKALKDMDKAPVLGYEGRSNRSELHER